MIFLTGMHKFTVVHIIYFPPALSHEPMDIVMITINSLLSPLVHSVTNTQKSFGIEDVSKSNFNSLPKSKKIKAMIIILLNFKNYEVTTM